MILFEKILSNYLIYYSRSNNLINENQFGFLSGKSTDLQLLKFYRNIFLAKDGPKCSDIVYINLEKAFDKIHYHINWYVPHKMLIQKLYNIGIQGEVIE